MIASPAAAAISPVAGMTPVTAATSPQRQREHHSIDRRGTRAEFDKNFFNP